MRHRCRTIIAIVLANLGGWCFGQDAKPDGEEVFVRRVLPVFQEKCWTCHGADAKDVRGQLDMRSRGRLLRGGESGEPALVPGKPDESPIYLAVTRTNKTWGAMPPKENDRLSREQVEAVRQWILSGAPWPSDDRIAELRKQSDKWNAADGALVKTSGGLSRDWTNRRYKPDGLWAYQPVRKPALANTSPRHPIDALIAAKLPVVPAPRADRRTLIRRATFDLLGLPPTPDDVTAFLNDPLPNDAAFEKVVNRLLASSHYGEHWARHWLDVVRYADSSGFANDYERGNAWRYRDYVVRAFNEDKPYNQFVKEQIAGDERAESTNRKSEISDRKSELLIATGFLRMGPWELTGMEVAKIARQRFLDDVTNSVGETFLAHSLQCARCHDHKFDPVPTQDYYSIQACFSTTQLTEREAPFLMHENTSGFEEAKYLEAHRAEHLSELQRLDDVHLRGAEAWFAEQNLDRSIWDKAIAAARVSISQAGQARRRRDFQGLFDAARGALLKQNLPEVQVPPKGVGFSPQDYGRERVARKGLERLKWELDRYEPFAFGVYAGRTPQMTAVYQPLRMPQDRLTAGELEETAILGGGDPFSPTTKVRPGVLSVLSEISDLKSQIPEAIEGRRWALAEWIASARNPLTTRAIVNRIWLWHFGQALAGNPNNFGSSGKRPTHPELLDWLAATFVEQGWSFKAMHRLVMTSEVYCRSSEFSGQVSASNQKSRDELEQSYAVFRPRRLTAEEFRDAMLSITGELSPQLGGIPNRPEINLEAALQPRQVMGTFASAWVPNPLPRQRHRRSLYALKIRGLRDPMLEVFNEPGPDFSCEARDVSTVTPQVFSLFNSQTSYDRALALAHRVLKESPDEAQAVRRVFDLAYGRGPDAAELQACRDHWQVMFGRQKALTFAKQTPLLDVTRTAVEENTGEKFTFRERLSANADFIPDLQPADVDARTRALADVCLVILNANEFAYVY
jgi:mono/diheme cytochrome c family protein